MHARNLSAGGWLARLLALAAGLIGPAAFACVDQATYDANHGSTGGRTHVGSWFIFQFQGSTGNPVVGTSGTCATKTYSDVLACGKAAIQVMANGAGKPSVTYGPNTTAGEGVNDIKINCTMTKADGTSPSTCNFKIRRITTSWPSGYEDEVCPGVDCADLANQMHLGQATDQPDSFVPADSICVKTATVDTNGVAISCAAWRMVRQGSNCVQPDGTTGKCTDYKRMGPEGQRDILVRYKFSGLECDNEPEQPETPIEPECETDITGSISCTEDTQEKCHTANGLTWCEGTENKQNCGFANNKYVCLDSLQPDKCFAMPDGSRLCAPQAPTPPVPDNGTPGVKATPDSNMQTCTGQGSCTQNNYYNSTTSSGSSRDPGDGPNPDGSGAVGPGGVPGGTGDGEGEEDSAASGGVSCTDTPVCSGDPVQCAQLLQQYKTRCIAEPSDVELFNAFGAIEGDNGEIFQSAEFTAPEAFNATGWMSGGGQCLDDYTVTLGGQLGAVEIPFSEWCWLLEVIGAFVMVASYVSAARIVIGGL